MASDNETDDEFVVYWALNGYGVTVLDLIANSLTLLLGVVIVILNAIVLDTMIRLKKHHEPTDIMLCSLAIADFMMGLFMFYHTSYNLANYQSYLECLIRLGILNGLIVTSVLHLTAVTLDRYIKIISPYRYTQLCGLTAVGVISIVLWIIAALMAFIPAMGWNRRPMNGSSLYTVRTQEDLPTCSYFGLMHPDYLRFLLVLFFASFILMGLLYLHIFKIANKHARSIAAQESSQPAPKLRDRHSWKYTKTVLIVMGLYFLCWLPAGCILMLFVSGNLSDKTVSKQGSLLLYASTTAYANSVVNPIIYAFKITVVRARFRAICCWRARKGMDTETSVPDPYGNGNATSVVTQQITRVNEPHLT